LYKHVTDTTRRIPYGALGNALENLTVATRMLLARAGQTEITWVARSPATLDDLRVFLVELFTPFGVPPEELIYFVTRLMIVATSCPERRLAEFENIAWWDFIAAPRMSKTYQAYLGQGLTRSLVAMRAEESSTRTVGVTQWQLLYGLICPDRVFDRLLSGPTSDVWIDPWTQYLRNLGVEFLVGTRVTGIHSDGARVTGVAVDGGPPVEADFYIAALPVEVMAQLITNDLKRAAPSLANLDKLQTRWMNGIQFFLSQDVPVVNGRRSIWTRLGRSPLSRSGNSGRRWTSRNGKRCAVRGILSVDISEWQAPGVVYGKPAQECIAAEIQEEVWTQLKEHLNVGGTTTLVDRNRLSWFLDPDIEFPNPGTATNAEPLLINAAGSLQYRPEAQVELKNLFLASDYVRTYTDIACMEAANEAARRAVNCLLVAAGSGAPPAQLWPLEEPAFLKPFQEIDRIRFGLGLPHHLASA
jgi:15-cis-phytoene desaturase